MCHLPLVVVTLLLTLHVAIIQGQLETPYASRQQLNNLETKLNGKINSVEKELEKEKEVVRNEQSFWNRALLSLMDMIHSATSGTFAQQYFLWSQQKQQFDKIDDKIEEIEDYIELGSKEKPASSCKELRPNSTSYLYWLKDSAGKISQQYCAMDLDMCGTRGGWMRVAYIDMTQPEHNCPSGFTNITTPKRLCGRPGPRGCASTTFPTNGFPYNKVCGKIIGYQYKTPDAHCPYHYDRRLTIDNLYMDGVSLTHGSNPRKHIWSFIASHGEMSIYGACNRCPCYVNYTSTRIPFIGEDYFCDTGSRTSALHKLYEDDPLWDGRGCGPNNNCCTYNSPPWFDKTLNTVTTDDLEVRMCGDEPTSNEDIPIELIELYVQ